MVAMKFSSAVLRKAAAVALDWMTVELQAWEKPSTVVLASAVEAAPCLMTEGLQEVPTEVPMEATKMARRVQNLAAIWIDLLCAHWNEHCALQAFPRLLFSVEKLAGLRLMAVWKCKRRYLTHFVST